MDTISYSKNDYKVGPIAQDTRVKLLINSRLHVELVRDSKYYFICSIENYSDMKFILVGIHLPSKLNARDNDQTVVISDLIHDISEAKSEIKTDSVLIVGDFNANPFEDMILSVNGIHAIPYADIVALKRKRTVYGKQRELYYNPMWNFLGDYQVNNGMTYYYDSNHAVNLYRNIFDQVILSASMVKCFEMKSLSILKNIGEYFFVDSKGHPWSDKFSDHLPIVFSIKEEI